MQNMGLLMEYEDILLKKRKDFSATYIGQNASQKDIKELFQYVFENLLEWTPEMARDYLTMDIIQKLREKAESKINNAKFEKGGPLSLCGNEESPFIFMEYSRLFIDEIPSEWN